MFNMFRRVPTTMLLDVARERMTKELGNQLLSLVVYGPHSRTDVARMSMTALPPVNLLIVLRTIDLSMLDRLGKVGQSVSIATWPPQSFADTVVKGG